MFHEFIQYMQFEKRCSEHTITAYQTDLNQFQSYFELKLISDLRELTSLGIRSWVVHLIDSGLTNRSVNRKIASLRSLFRWLRKEGVVSLNPMAKLQGPKNEKRLPVFVIIPLYLLLGFYGGFVQMGIGVFFLFVTVLGARYNIIDAGALRTVCIALYTPLAIGIFAWHGLIHWDLAIIMASAEWTGGFLGGRFATTNAKAEVWAQRLLVVVLITVIIIEFRPWNWF